MASPTKVAVVVGAGTKYSQDGGAEMPPSSRWGLGGALSLRFAAGGFHVVLLGRRVPILEEVADAVRAEGGTATTCACDVTDDDSVKRAFDVARDVGDVEVLLFNAAPGLPEGRDFWNMPAPHEVDPAYLQTAFNIGVTGCVRCTKHVMPQMLERKRGTVLLTGATMSLRGSAKFAALSPVKFALRSLGQSMFQEYAPQGVHVGHVILDGVIESPGTLAVGEKVTLLNPAHLADVYFDLHLQKSTTWSYEIQVSPQSGTVGTRM